MEHVIRTTWNGTAVDPSHWVRIGLERDGGGLGIAIDAPLYADPAPAAPAGPTDGLWAFEVVELFVLGTGRRYLEVEMGPHGHYLVLLLEGKRNVIDRMLPMSYTARILGSRWQCTARVPAACLPRGADSGNAYAVHGPPGHRAHLALYPLGGAVPDFHRLGDFGPLLDGTA